MEKSTKKGVKSGKLLESVSLTDSLVLFPQRSDDKPLPADALANYFVIVTEDKLLHLSASSPGAMEEWVHALRNASAEVDSQSVNAKIKSCARKHNSFDWLKNRVVSVQRPADSAFGNAPGSNLAVIKKSVDEEHAPVGSLLLGVAQQPVYSMEFEEAQSTLEAQAAGDIVILKPPEKVEALSIRTKGNAYGRKWDKRMLTVKCGQLEYADHTSKTSSPPIGAFDLSMCIACPGQLDEKQWTIMLAQTSDDRLLIHCDDKQAMIDWCGYLNYAIEIATGNISVDTLKQLYDEVGESAAGAATATGGRSAEEGGSDASAAAEVEVREDSNLGGEAETGGEGSTSLSASQRAMISETGAKPPAVLARKASRQSVLAGGVGGAKKQTRAQLRKKSTAAAMDRKISATMPEFEGKQEEDEQDEQPDAGYDQEDRGERGDAGGRTIESARAQAVVQAPVAQPRVIQPFEYEDAPRKPPPPPSALASICPCCYSNSSAHQGRSQYVDLDAVGGNNLEQPLITGR
jgi:hypothetical protein